MYYISDYKTTEDTFLHIFVITFCFLWSNEYCIYFYGKNNNEYDVVCTQNLFIFHFILLHILN